MYSQYVGDRILAFHAMPTDDDTLAEQRNVNRSRLWAVNSPCKLLGSTSSDAVIETRMMCKKDLTAATPLCAA